MKKKKNSENGKTTGGMDMDIYKIRDMGSEDTEIEMLIALKIRGLQVLELRKATMDFKKNKK